MRIILDTDKKTITVPWNYQDKLEAMNAILKDAGTDKVYDFKKYIDDIWKNCIENSDKCLKTASKPVKNDKR